MQICLNYMMFTYFEVEKLMYKFKYAEKQPSSII